MTDNDIIKAYGLCHSYVLCDETNCPFFAKCKTEDLSVYILDLINRQKAEIEVKNKLLDIAEEKFETIKADTIQEFIKRFEKKIKDVKFTIGQTWEIKSAIKEVVKEMVGEN